jgi:hypothetical protein
MGPAQLVLPLGLPLPVVGEAFAADVAVVVERGQLADSLDFAHVNLRMFSYFSSSSKCFSACPTSSRLLLLNGH